MSRAQLTSVRKLLEEEKKKKFEELSLAEASLEDYEKKTGIISMEENVKNLIVHSSEIEALKNENDIEIKVAESNLAQLQSEYKKIDPQLNAYITSKINEPYFNKILGEIANVEVQKQLALSDVTNPKVRAEIEKDSENKIAALRKDYDSQLQIMKTGINATSPNLKEDLSTKLLQAEIDARSLKSKQNAIAKVTKGYDAKFNELPSTVIEYAKLERNKTAAEKLYTTLEGKFQEALINERSRLGNASIIDPGTDNYGPIAPNRVRLILIGTSVGLALGFLFVFGLDKFDRTIKTPEDLEHKGISVLCWIPNIEETDLENSPSHEFLMHMKNKSNISEAFKALRTRIQFAKLEEKPLKSILITSSIPSEDKGKMIIDGIEREDLDISTFQNRIGYITQDPVIFNDSIFNNVSFWAEPTAENKLRFENAIKKASIVDFVNGLPEKENSVLGHYGVNLSGGQKQRISIARELYKDIDILILDEATSALDSETEKAIQDNIDSLKGYYTILIVAHRLSTIKNASRIVFMNEGKISQIGEFSDLINKVPHFKRMVELQDLQK
ncbi:unnamed protein product [Rotaria sp. Silwood1]|nr:unnamed protein product [Rotaria sp. Silwood1]CAF4669263.1 unnamed protein product [Rotaria sp. Silwood1]